MNIHPYCSLILVASLAIACSKKDPPAATEAQRSPFLITRNDKSATPLVAPGKHAHVYPTRQYLQSANPKPQWSTPPHLNYNGGKIVEAPEIVAVRWGNAGPTLQGWGEVYRVLSGAYMNALKEYDTSAQHYGRGKSVNEIGISPASASTSLSAADVEAEIQRQVTNGVLPKPDDNILFFILLPSNTTFSIGGQTSCVNFCAVHTSAQINVGGSMLQVRYAVFPEPSNDGCNGNCSPGEPFQQIQTTISHEFTEMVTDPDPRTGWDDPNPKNDEIADICSCAEVGGSSQWTWDTCQGWSGGIIVQKEWSNQQNQCIVPACRADCPVGYCGYDRAGCRVYCDCGETEACEDGQCVERRCPKPGDSPCYCNGTCMSAEACDRVCRDTRRFSSIAAKGK